MSSEFREWIAEVQQESPRAAIGKRVDDLEESGANIGLVSLYGQVQDAAMVYKKAGQDIPQGLVDLVNVLADRRSGFTGLTVHMVYVEYLREKLQAEKQQNNLL